MNLESFENDSESLSGGLESLSGGRSRGGRSRGGRSRGGRSRGGRSRGGRSRGGRQSDGGRRRACPKYCRRKSVKCKSYARVHHSRKSRAHTKKAPRYMRK